MNAIRNLNSFHMSVYEKRTITAMASEHINAFKKDALRFENDLQLFMVHCFNCTLKFFHENPEHMVAMADKGNISVILLKTEYTNKVELHLSDTSTYSLVKTSSHIGYMKRNETLLKQLADLNIIHRNAIPSIIANETRIPNLYGLIKLHKMEQPIRPVVNTKSSPGYTLAAVLTKLFSTARESHRYNVLNSVDVCERLAYITPDPDEYLATLDIKNMFTNISVDMAIASISKRYHAHKINHSIPLKTIIDIIRFVASFATEVQFNNITYKQIRGLKMGSSLSQILSDFVIEDIIDGIFIYIEKPKMLMKYVDDCAILARKQHINEITQALNDANENLVFELTMEDANGCVSYLDMTILNTHTFNILTKWQQKPMASGRFLNYYSSHPRSTIINTAKCFVYNMYKTTHKSLISGLEKTAEHLLRINNFPVTLRNKIIFEAIQKWRSNTDYNELSKDTILLNESDPFHISSSDTHERAIYVSLPFFNNVTPTIQDQIAHVSPNIKSIGKPIDTMKRMYDQHKNLNTNNDAKRHKNSFR